MFIAIIDYGAGNLRSVEKALKKLGFKSVITKDKAEIMSASGIILPGVGAFDAAVKELRSKGLELVIQEIIAKDIPFLGICLGYQLLFENSEEGKEKGLSILKGKARKFDFSKIGLNLSVPHMGWNQLLIKNTSNLFDGIKNGDMVYFAHSYYCDPENESIISTATSYGIEFVSSITKNNVFGIQFHPEKSGNVGLKILNNFGDLCLK